MNPLRNTAALLILLEFTSVLFAQPRFEVPLRISDGFDSDTLYFGILSAANFCIVSTDCFVSHCEFFLPPVPPTGVFDARFICPRVGCELTCFDQGSSNDFRPFITASQRDTFRVRAQLGAGTTMTLCWPSGLSAYFTELTMCGIDMLTDTCATSPFPEENNKEGLPERIILFQNYPNPFNPTTTLSFVISHSSFVTLKVYDVLGREVTTLIEGEQVAGEHRVEWRPEGVSSGIYTYRLSTPNATIVKKMLLLR